MIDLKRKLEALTIIVTVDMGGFKRHTGVSEVEVRKILSSQRKVCKNTMVLEESM